MKYVVRREGGTVVVINPSIDGPVPKERGLEQEECEGSTGSPDYFEPDEDERCFVLSTN